MSLERARDLLDRASRVRPQAPNCSGGRTPRLEEYDEAKRDAHARRLALIVAAFIEALDAANPVSSTELVPCKPCNGQGARGLYVCPGCHGAGVHRV